MLNAIIRREITEHIVSLRFILSFVLVVILFTASSLLFVYHYRLSERDFWHNANANRSVLFDKSKELLGLTFHQQQLWKRPLPLMFISEGFDSTLPNKYELNMFEMEYPSVSSRVNYLSSYSRPLDLVFIVSVILSLTAIMLTHDSISGEREGGTLRLMLSGPLSRYHILLGKYLSSLITLAIPMTFGLLVSMGIVVVSQTLSIGMREMAVTACFLLISVLYVSMFVLLGISVSSTMKRSTNSMVILLIVWVALVIVVPGLGRIVSNVLYKIPSYTEIAKQSEAVSKDIWNQAHAGKFGENAIAASPNRDSPYVNPEAHMKRHQANTNASTHIFADYHNQMVSQVYRARNVLRFSPTVLFQRISESLTGTGIRRSMSLFEQIRNYQTQLKDFIRLQDAEDADSFHEIYDNDKVTRWWKSISIKPVAFDSIPKFQEQQLNLGASLRLAIWDIGLLVLFNLVFFAASLMFFLEHDVR